LIYTVLAFNLKHTTTIAMSLLALARRRVWAGIVSALLANGVKGLILVQINKAILTSVAAFLKGNATYSCYPGFKSAFVEFSN
jgi:hypothetical protein